MRTLLDRESAEPPAVNRPLRFLAQPSLLLLLVLGAVILVYPFLETSNIGRAGLSAINIGLMIVALRVIGHTPRLRRAGLLLALPPIFLHGYYVLSGRSAFGLATAISLAAFYACAIRALLACVLRDGIGTTDEPFATVCVYVVIAILWPCLYWVVRYF